LPLKRGLTVPQLATTLTPATHPLSSRALSFNRAFRDFQTGQGGGETQTWKIRTSSRLHFNISLLTYSI
jgi:hypothetical protein